MRATETVSVVMVVRNGERHLEGALRSIEEQSVAPGEIVLIDGNSQDATPDIARRHPLVRVLQQRGPTISDAYNEGVAASTGELIAFLSYDDVWTPRKLELQVARLRAAPPVDGCIGLAQRVIDPGDEAPPGFRRELLDEPRAARIPETLLLRRRTWERVGPMRPDCGSGGDTEWFARAQDLGVVLGVVQEIVVRKRVHGDSTAHNAANTDAVLLRTVRESLLRKRAGGTAR
ncbi:MAG: glycosyltransferase [Solirubrobacteraceae bacterium]|jgi:glycosyltransferase involved in cell wall biosynthesis